MNVVGIIAIHGGNIEPGTSEIAKAIAKDNLSVFINTDSVHIESIDFNNEDIKKFLDRVDTVISIHGEKSVNESFIMIGGLDKELAAKIKQSLEKSDFITQKPPERLDGDNLENICNRGRSGKGVQIEISRKLRDELMQDNNLMEKFAGSVLQF